MTFRAASIGLVAVLAGLGLAHLAPGGFAAAGTAIVRQAQAAPMSRAEARRLAANLAELGRALFFDPALSASGQMSCATCHSPDHAFGSANALPVQLGGSDMRQHGLRAVPSLKYLQVVPQFTEHFFDNEDEADEAVDNGPSGGLMWDGRVDSGHAQAAFPLLSPFEMGNSGPAEVVARARGRLRCTPASNLWRRHSQGSGRSLRRPPQGLRSLRAGLSDLLSVQQQI